MTIILFHFLEWITARILGAITRADIEMVDTLLKHGARPNDKYRSSTVWITFLKVLSSYQSVLNKDVRLSILESLLSHGGNLQQHIITGQKTREIGVHSQKQQEVQSDIVKSAHQILLEELGEEETSELLKRARKNQTVLPSRSKWWSGRSLRASIKALKR